MYRAYNKFSSSLFSAGVPNLAMVETVDDEKVTNTDSATNLSPSPVNIFRTYSGC